MPRMGSWLASDTDALQLDTGFGAPVDRAPTFCDRCYPGNRGELFLVFLAEFLETRITTQRVPERIEPKKGWSNGRWGVNRAPIRRL
jgi:hypothetical protein